MEKTYFTQKAVNQLSEQLGLRTSTVLDLLNRGWSFHEDLKDGQRFEAPISALHDRRW